MYLRRVLRGQGECVTYAFFSRTKHLRTIKNSDTRGGFASARRRIKISPLERSTLRTLIFRTLQNFPLSFSRCFSLQLLYLIPPIVKSRFTTARRILLFPPEETSVVVKTTSCFPPPSGTSCSASPDNRPLRGVGDETQIFCRFTIAHRSVHFATTDRV